MQPPDPWRTDDFTLLTWPENDLNGAQPILNNP
jgi:hypothetical protein